MMATAHPNGAAPVANVKTGQPAPRKGRTSIRLGRTPPNKLPVVVPRSVRRKLQRDDLLMTVKIEGRAGDPGRLSEAQRRRIERLAATIKGEMTIEDFLAEENPGLVNNSQEDIPMDEDTTLEAASQGKPKRKINRKPKTAVAATPVNGNGTVRLTPEQASKLWEAVTGGKIYFGGASEVTIEVTLDSFPKALPVLLDWMSGAAPVV